MACSVLRCPNCRSDRLEFGFNSRVDVEFLVENLSYSDDELFESDQTTSDLTITCPMCPWWTVVEFRDGVDVFLPDDKKVRNLISPDIHVVAEGW